MEIIVLIRCSSSDPFNHFFIMLKRFSHFFPWQIGDHDPDQVCLIDGFLLILIMRPMKHKEKEDGKEKPQVKSSHCYVRNHNDDDDDEEEEDDDDDDNDDDNDNNDDDDYRGSKSWRTRKGWH